MSVVSILSKIFVCNTLATILIIAGHYIFATNQSLVDKNVPDNVLDSYSTDGERHLVFVSTMDGYVTALNGRTGQLQWTLSTGSGSLLSSSISEQPMIRQGRETRLVPSLDGGLYQMDEDGVEPIPIGADALLSSTVKLFDSSTVVGGRSIESYAIDLTSGKVKYICTMDGCELVDLSSSNESMFKQTTGDVLLVRRNDRVIRMIDMLSGMERWNYSVGQHDLTFVSSAEVIKSIDEFISSWKSKKNYVNYSERLFKNDASDKFKDHNEDPIVDVEDLSIKVHMSSGLIKASSKIDPMREYWSYKFDNAVAAMWKLEGRRLIETDLFLEDNIIELDATEQLHLGSRTLYIGRFNDQPYIQPSQQLKKELDAALDQMGKSKDPVAMPRARWRPYIYNALSRTRTKKKKVPTATLR